MPILKKNIKIAVVDDHKLVRESIAMILSSKFNIFFQADNGKDFIERVISGDKPDIVVLDIHMPEMNGVETAVWLKEKHPDIKILILTMYDNEEMIIKMFKIGVNAYLLKSSSPEELVTAVESVWNKGYYFDDFISSKFLDFIRRIELPEKPSEPILNAIKQLTPRELEILNLLSKGLTDSEISKRLTISRKTVEYSRYKMMDKLQVKNRIELINLVFKKGHLN